MNFFLIYLLIAGIATPFVVQAIKHLPTAFKLNRIKNAPALLLSLVVDGIFALLTIWFAGASFSIWNMAGAFALIFIASTSTYVGVVDRFLSGTGSAQT